MEEKEDRGEPIAELFPSAIVVGSSRVAGGREGATTSYDCGRLRTNKIRGLGWSFAYYRVARHPVVSVFFAPLADYEYELDIYVIFVNFTGYVNSKKKKISTLLQISSSSSRIRALKKIKYQVFKCPI